MTSEMVMDANVLVALIDRRDKWHPQAVALRDALIEQHVRLIYFDCVVNETVGVIGRRAEEQRRSDQFGELLDDLSRQIPASSITWISREGERLHDQVLALCRAHGGHLNYNDALMAVFCREKGWQCSVGRRAFVGSSVLTVISMSCRGCCGYHLLTRLKRIITGFTSPNGEAARWCRPRSIHRESPSRSFLYRG